jgi:hypothetical protein
MNATVQPDGHPERSHGMETPRFAAHLPPGKFLDWAWEKNPSKRNQFGATPGLHAIREAWDELDDADIARLASASGDPAVLDWIAEHGSRRSGVRAALLRNPCLPYPTLARLVERGTNAAEREGVANARRADELCRLLLDGYPMSTNPRQLTAWMVGGFTSTTPEEKLITEANTFLPDDHLPGLMSEILRVPAAETDFPLEAVVELVAELAPALQENTWKSLGQHLAARGTTKQIRRAMQASTSPALRAALVNARKITLQQAFARVDNDHRGSILRQLGPERPLAVEDAPLVNALAGEIGAATKAARTLLHGLKYEQPAVDWLLANADPHTAGTVVWHGASDPALLSVLRRNPESHAFAGAHIWRTGRIWDRLSGRTKTAIVSTFDAVVLSNLAPGPIRAWIIAHGPVQAVGGLTLRKTEQRTLLDRVERERNPALAWVAARVAERPRDRVRMAEIGAGGENWEQAMRTWLRGASSGEITRLWSSVEPEQRNRLGVLLVAGLRGSDETSWLDKLVSELRIDWQQAPQAVQEAAAHWIAGRCGNDPETWQFVWTLYPEWNGTLPELLEAADNV